MDAGYVLAATDYQGLGTPGPHPYLVGAAEAMNALDSVRAARNLTEAGASSDFVFGVIPRAVTHRCSRASWPGAMRPIWSS